MSPGAVVCADVSSKSDKKEADTEKDNSLNMQRPTSSNRSWQTTTANNAYSNARNTNSSVRGQSIDRPRRSVSRSGSSRDPMPSRTVLKASANASAESCNRPLPPIRNEITSTKRTLKMHGGQVIPVKSSIPVKADKSAGYVISSQNYEAASVAGMDRQSRRDAMPAMNRATRNSGKAILKQTSYDEVVDISDDVVKGRSDAEALKTIQRPRSRSTSCNSQNRSRLPSTPSTKIRSLEDSPLSQQRFSPPPTNNSSANYSTLDRRKTGSIRDEHLPSMDARSEVLSDSTSSTPDSFRRPNSQRAKMNSFADDNVVLHYRASKTKDHLREQENDQNLCNNNSPKKPSDQSGSKMPDMVIEGRPPSGRRSLISAEKLPETDSKSDNSLSSTKDKDKTSPLHVSSPRIPKCKSLDESKSDNRSLQRPEKLVKDRASASGILDVDLCVCGHNDEKHHVLGGKSDVDATSSVQEEGAPAAVGKREKLASVSSASDDPAVVVLQAPELRFTKGGAMGLRNLGNTCFMNSILQCLSNTRPLLEYCMDDSYISDINRSTSRMKGTLVREFAHVIKSLWSSERTSAAGAVAPVKFKDQISQIAKRFVGCSEHDAHEFLIYLLEGLHEELNRVLEKKKRYIDCSNEVERISAAEKAKTSWKKYIECDDSKIVDIFVGQLKSILTCEECGYISNTFESFHDLSLPIKRNKGLGVFNDNATLGECFDLFTQEEMLGGDDRPTCAKCRCRRRCTKRYMIQKFPRILIIHLKRFNPGSGYFKLKTSVDCPLTGLDLAKYSSDPGCAPVLYNLYAVSNHSGTMMSGHYTAYAKHPYTDKWHCFNDSSVTDHRLTKLNSSEAYLLFYELDTASLQPSS